MTPYVIVRQVNLGQFKNADICLDYCILDRKVKINNLILYNKILKYTSGSLKYLAKSKLSIAVRVHTAGYFLFVQFTGSEMTEQAYIDFKHELWRKLGLLFNPMERI